MILRKVDVVIYVEHVARELEAAVLLKRRLAAKSISTIILPLHFDRYWSLLKYVPKVIVIPFFYSSHDRQIERIAKSYYKVSPVIVNLHQEQISGPAAWPFMLPSDIDSRSVVHFAWGNEFAEKLLASHCPKETVYTLGAIRAEVGYLLAQHKLRYYASPHKRILVTLNFGFAFFSDDYIQNIIDRGRQDALSEQECARTSLAWFTDLLIRVVGAKPDIDFEIRPHPSDPPHAYMELRKCLQGRTNVIFSREDTIHHRLMETDAVLTWTSTTAIEAQLMGVPSACLVRTDEIGKMDFICYWNYFHQADEVLAWLDAGCPVQPSMETYLNNVYGDYERASYATAEKIADLILDKNHATLQVFSGLLLLLIQSITIDVPKHLLLSLGLLSTIRSFYSRVEGTDLQIEEKLIQTEKRISALVD